MSEWKPIDTAPKDGSEVLLYLGAPWYGRANCGTKPGCREYAKAAEAAAIERCAKTLDLLWDGHTPKDCAEAIRALLPKEEG